MFIRGLIHSLLLRRTLFLHSVSFYFAHYSYSGESIFGIEDLLSSGCLWHLLVQLLCVLFNGNFSGEPGSLWVLLLFWKEENIWGLVITC